LPVDVKELSQDILNSTPSTSTFTRNTRTWRNTIRNTQRFTTSRPQR